MLEDPEMITSKFLERIISKFNFYARSINQMKWQNYDISQNIYLSRMLSQESTREGVHKKVFTRRTATWYTICIELVKVELARKLFFLLT